MLDEWGEEIENIQDEGVFSDTALGSMDGPTPKPEATPGAAMGQGFLLLRRLCRMLGQTHREARTRWVWVALTIMTE